MLKNLLIFALIGLVSVGCGDAVERSKERRHQQMQKLHKERGPIIIGVAGSSRTDQRTQDFIRGAEIARDEINARGGIIYDHKNPEENSRRLELAIRYEADYAWRYFYARRRNKDQAIARDIGNSFAANTSLLAVLGHGSSSYAIPASVVYEQHDILYLSPFATNIALTRHNFRMTFRTIPDNYLQAQQTAGYCAKFRGYKNVAVLYARGSLYTEELTEMFEDTAIELGMNIVYRRSFLAKDTNYSAVLAGLRSIEGVDAIFIAASYKAASAMIKQAREAGIEAPFVGSDGLVKQEIIQEAGKAANGLVAPVPFNPHFNLAQDFVRAFRRLHGKSPGYSAAQGYDGIKLIAHTIKKISPNEPTPLRLATEIRFMPFWIGVTGLHIFDEDGNIYGKKYYFWELKDGNYYVIPGANVPAVLHDLESNDDNIQRLNLD